VRGISSTVFIILIALSIGSAAAKDQDKDKGTDKGTHGPDRAAALQANPGAGHFGDRDHDAVRAYYANAHGGHCPPGLAKKGDGCLPPGQARKWLMGQPLPANVVYSPVPAALVVQLTPPPVGYSYVRVAGDILMIAAGTHMVVDAIQDLGYR
jgi:Ni/Co efflux regulator RcnB